MMESQASPFQSEFSPGAVSPPAHDSAALAAFVPASARAILDCGLGDGWRAEAIKKRGSGRLTVVPLANEAPVADHPADTQTPTVFGSESFTLGDAAYDCIVCDNGLAKLRDAEPAMAQLAMALRPGGLAVFTVPNIQHYRVVEMLAQGRWDLEDGPGALARDHLRFFTALELVNLAKRNGLDVQRCAALESDPPDAMPLDSGGSYRNGHLTIGPLNADEHKLFLAKTLLLLATRPG